MVAENSLPQRCPNTGPLGHRTNALPLSLRVDSDDSCHRMFIYLKAMHDHHGFAVTVALYWVNKPQKMIVEPAT